MMLFIEMDLFIFFCQESRLYLSFKVADMRVHLIQIGFKEFRWIFHMGGQKCLLTLFTLIKFLQVINVIFLNI